MAFQSPALVRWFYTYNNPKDKPLDWIPNELIKWHVCQFETGASGTDHIQGVVHFVKRKRLTALVKEYPGVHWETQRGSNDQAKAYCTKEDTRRPDTQPFIYGEPESASLSQIIIEMAKKRQYADISVEYPDQYLRHYQAIKGTADLTTTKPPNLKWVRGKDTPPNLWIYGPPHSGKSHYAQHHWSLETTYEKPRGKWWPGYHGQSTVFFDDILLTEHLLLSDLKTWSDVRAFYVEDKGTGTWIRPERIIVTSNHSIWQYMDKHHGDQLEAIRSRFHEIEWNPSMQCTCTNCKVTD